MTGQDVIPPDRIDTGDGGGKVESAEAAWERFVFFLKASRREVTTARHIVFSRVCELPGHFSADDLAAQLAHGRMRVSRATVFRTLELLVEAGVVGKVRDLHGHARHEHLFDRFAHEHMICDKCQRYIGWEKVSGTDLDKMKSF